MSHQISEERTRKEMIDASTGFRQAQSTSSARRPQLVRARAGESERQGEGLFQGLLSQSFGG